jgi:hypothetical protein
LRMREKWGCARARKSSNEERTFFAFLSPA